MSPGGPTAPATLIVHRVDETLLLRTAADPEDELTGLVTRLPAEPGRIAVVSAPSVTGRADLSAVLPAVLIEQLGGSAAGIRLVLLGDLHAAAAAFGRSVADEIGQEVLLPPAGLRPGTAGEHLGSDDGWLVCRPGQPVHTGPSWPPSPVVPQPADHPAARAHRTLTLTRPPLVWRAPLYAPPPAATPPGGDRHRPAPEVPPGSPTAAGWSFLPGPPAGRLRPLSAFVVEVPLAASGCLVAGRPIPPRRLAQLIEQCRNGQADRPVLLSVTGPDIAPSAAEALFGSLAAALGGPIVVARNPVACTATGLLSALGGFRRWPAAPVPAGRPPADPDASAAAARRRGALPGPLWPGQPRGRRYTVARRPAPPRPAPPALTPHPQPISAALIALLAVDRWRARVAPVAVPRFTPALAMASIDAAGALTEPDPVPVPVVAPRPAPLGGLAVSVPRLPVVPPPLETRFADAASPAVAPRPAAVEPEAQAPRWLVVGDGAATDRQGLRQALNGSYDAHARVVARTLAEQPGLRAAGGRDDLVTGLVALRAYCVAERGVINEVLRGEPPTEPAAERAARVARCAVHGLRRLPAVFGPVFVAGPAGVEPPVAYRPGDELIEPAFLDVDLAGGGDAPGAAVQFVIWSVSARRLTALGAGDSAGLFAPGTRFAVLAVDPRMPGSPARVHLRDLTAVPSARAGARGGGRHEDTEQILSQLRAARGESPAAGGARGAGAATPGASPCTVRAVFLPGLDGAGRRFRAPLDPVAGQPGAVAALLRSTER